MLKIFSLKLAYDNSKLTYVNFQNPHSQLSSGTLSINASGGFVNIDWNSSSSANIARDTLLELTFDVLAQTSATNANLDWDETNSTILDNAGNPITTTFNDALVSINPLPGDPDLIVGATSLCQSPSVQTYTTGSISNADSYIGFSTQLPLVRSVEVAPALILNFDPSFTGLLSLSVHGSMPVAWKCFFH